MPPPPDPRTDSDLVDALNRGDAAAFDALYYRHRDQVVRLARRFTDNEEDALDVLQETFAYLHRKFPGFRLTAAMNTFLFPVVKHLSLARRRRRRMLTGTDTADHALEMAADGSPPAAGDQRADLAVVVGSLPEAQRQVVLLRFVDGFSLDEIAIALHVPLGTVKSRLHNALAVLRDDPKTREYFDAPKQKP